MNKFLLIVSFVLISLLAVGAVSAEDSGNITGSVDMPMASADIDEELDVDETDTLKSTSEIEDLEVEEEPLGLSESNNQSTDVLSEDNANSNKPSVTIGDVTFDSVENITIPFHVADSNGNPISGGVIVSIYGETNSLSKYVKLYNGDGQVKFKISEIINVMTINSTDVYDILNSSTNINASKIIDGLNDIYNGFSINISNIIDGIDEIENGNYINTSEIKNGLILIKDAFYINITSITEGINDIINGIKINVSSIIQSLIPKDEFNFTKFRDDLKVIIDGFDLKNLSSVFNITLNKTAIDHALGIIYNLFNITSSDVISKIDDLMDYLNLTDELKYNITTIIEGKNLNLSYIIQTVKDVIGSNLTINVSDAFSKFIGGINFNFNASEISNALHEIYETLKVDYNKIIESINMYDINSSKIIDRIVNITGINITKISNIFDGIMLIMGGVTFNMSSFKDFTNRSNFNFTNAIVDIISGINISDNFTSSLGCILEQFGITPALAMDTFAKLSEHLNLNFTDEFGFLLLDLYLGNDVNLTQALTVIKDMSDINNLTMRDILLGLYNVTGGDIFNIPKIISIIKDPNFNVSKVVDSLKTMFKSVSFDYSKIFTGISNLINSINITPDSDGLVNILGINFNTSAIKNGYDKICQETNFNASKIISGLIDNVRNIISINTTLIIEGLNKIIDSFNLNISSIKDGVSSIANSFKFNITSIINGASKIFNSLKYNTSYFNNGIEKIKNGTHIDISNIITQIITKIANGAVLSFVIIPDSTIIPVVFKLPTRIAASKVSVTYGNSKKMVITLKDIFGRSIAGKEVTVKLNGKTYTGKTNAKGQFSIKIPKNLAAKTYTAMISFAGDNTYAKSSGSAKVVVSKLTPKITAKKKAFKRSVKTKKYTVTLKTNKNKAMKNKKVTLKIKGKTYKAKTNNKGKATFKITKLTKKGTFNAVIKYNGDSRYKKATKKVKIKVK